METMTPATAWRVEQQITAQRREHEAFHALMELIPPALKDEAVRLWVQGTESAGSESYNRRLLMSELSDSEYQQTQMMVHKAWRELVGIKS